MNHPIDTDDETIVDPESCASTLLGDSERSRTASTLSLSKGRREDTKHSKLLDILIEKSIKRLEDNSFEPKIQDVLKAIQLKQEVVKTSEAEKIFWQEIDAIRRYVLPKLYPEPINLESQILKTIIGLKHLVKNGILPVKTITDTFNQGKSKESRLTYHRIGRLLSTMGFRKAKTQSGSSAIIWDDKLLQDESFLKIHFLTHRLRARRYEPSGSHRRMAEKNLKQSPVRSVRSEIPACGAQAGMGKSRLWK